MVKLFDLTQPFSIHSPPWPGYPAPIVRYIKRFPAEGIYGQYIETPLHISTHLDAPMHYVWGGKDIASIPLEKLYGSGVIVDVSEVGEWGIIKPRHVTDKIEIKENDILILHTGFHHYYEKDEIAYFMRHPGPDKEFAEWCIKMKFKWIGVDCGSADHPMNTGYLPKARPELVKEFEEKIGKKLDEIFPRKEVHPMHGLLFPLDIIHAENVGGDIDKLLNQRVTIGAFPWKFVGGEAALCRIVAFVE